MTGRVVVNFGGGSEYTLEVGSDALAAIQADEARAWMADQFDDFGCEPPNPMGKLLLADLLLGVARAAGPARFAADSSWCSRYAAAALCLRGAQALRVDVAAYELRVPA